MKKLTLALFIIFLSISCFSQVTQDDLLKDVVTVENNKFIATDYNLLKLSDGVTTYQIKSYAEAPSSGVISRDNFVFFFGYLTLNIIEGLTDDENATTDNLEELIGNPDIEINIYMAKSGFQVEVKNANGTNRFTQQWSEL